MEESLAFVSTGVAAGLQLSMPARSRLEKLMSILPLMKKEAIRTSNNLDAEEIV